ncbi:MAG: quinolinate synthase NadA [Syntrophobacteraceae bacterium]|nr:quinolinate synthase NadA [Desulfobacteraceae bacterium]
MEALPDSREVLERIRARKKELGRELLILTHHYQRKDIVALGDFLGDSFELSRKGAADRDCRYIVFCGVHFMAESSAILARSHQTVQIPCLEAGCWMAGMADAFSLERAFEEIISVAGDGSTVPIVYMNSDASIKAFCGCRGGTVCTSSNAPAAMRRGFETASKILFVPDRHLGQNTGLRLGLRPEEMIVWDPAQPLGGNDAESVRKARLILWNGYCLVHTRFEVEHMREARVRFPEARIVVHPECTREVVALADAVGSTGFIVNYVKKAPPGSTVVVGTEINLVHRLALEYPDRKVLDLRSSLCPNMFRINPGNLLHTMEHIGEYNVVTVPEATRADARLALDRMLALPS